MSLQLQDARLPSERSEFAGLVESSEIHVDPTMPLTAARLLRRLDVLRQRLAVRWCGTPGAFAGYDQLDICSDPGSVSGLVNLKARMIDAGETTHTVEMTASLVAAGDGSSPRTLAHGTGRTLHVAV